MRFPARGHWRETLATLSALSYWTLGLYLLVADALPWLGRFLGWQPWLTGFDN